MSAAQFSNVTVTAQADISDDGHSISRTVFFADGRHKTLGILLPFDDDAGPYRFETQSAERVEITSGACEVKAQDEETFNYYRAGQSFVVAGDSHFLIRCDEVVQYVRHLEE